MDNIVIKSVLVDTISSIFNGELVEQQVKSGKLRQNDWNNYGSDVSHLIIKLSCSNYFEYQMTCQVFHQMVFGSLL